MSVVLLHQDAHGSGDGQLYRRCFVNAGALVYNRSALREDYGLVRDYMAPRSTHPDSILWRSEYTALNAGGDILHINSIRFRYIRFQTHS